MSVILGLMAALISAILWGSNFVPMKLAKINPLLFHAIMCIGIFLSSIAYVVISNSALSINAFAVLAGISWGIGNIMAVKALELSGLSRALPTWAGISTFLAFLWGLILFKETLNSLPLGVFGILLFLIGIPLVSARDEKTKSRKGMYIAGIAGVIFSFYLVPFKLFNIGYGEWLISSSIGILLTSIPVFVLKFRQLKGFFHGFAGGVMWNAASLSSLYAVSFLGFAIGVPLTQLALIISALWGVFYFKEVKGRLAYKVMLGVILLFVAGVLLSVSKL